MTFQYSYLKDCNVVSMMTIPVRAVLLVDGIVGDTSDVGRGIPVVFVEVAPDDVEISWEESALSRSGRRVIERLDQSMDTVEILTVDLGSNGPLRGWWSDRSEFQHNGDQNQRPSPPFWCELKRWRVLHPTHPHDHPRW